MDRYKAFFEGPSTPPPSAPEVVESNLSKLTEGMFDVDPRIDNWFDINKVVAIDCETTDGKGGGSLDALDPNSNIAIIQTNIDDKIEIRRWNEETAEFIRDLNRKGYTFIFHNAAFDLFFLRIKGGIILDSVYDTMIGSQVINAGKVIPDNATRVSAKIEGRNIDNVGLYQSLFEEEDEFIEVKQKKVTKFSHNLAATVYRYAHATIVKDLGNSDWSRDPLTPEQIRYAEDDVRYLKRVMLNQMAVGKKFAMTNILKLEMELLPAVVDMRFWGIDVDRERWEEAIKEYAITAADLEKTLNSQIGMEMSIRAGEEDFGMFGAVPRVFSVRSPTQLKEFFKDEFLEGKPIENVSETTLKKLKHPLIPTILKYKEVDKLATTYGEGYLKHIRDDGRIHAEIKQTSNAQGDSIATGRFASSNPNLQNIPADLIKSLLRARQGYRLLTFDYSSVEARILAYAADDPNYIESVNAKDIHWENAKKMFHLAPDAPRDDKLRTKAKVITFSIPYGASPMGIWHKGNTATLEEAEELVAAFFTSFPKVKAFLDKSVSDALTRGYTQDFYGRVRWYEIPPPDKVDEQTLRRAQKEAARQAQNHPIQSLSASVTKMAIKDLYQMLRETGWGYMILTIHDSIFFEIKEGCENEAIPAILKIMEEAARKVMPVLKAPSDVEVGEKIIKKDKITGKKFKVYSHNWNKNTQQIEPNDDEIDPESTAKLLKELKIPITDDYMGMAYALNEKSQLQPVEWQAKNEKILSIVRERLEGVGM